MSDKMVVAYVCDEHYKQFLQISINSIKRYNKNVEFVVLSKDSFSIPDAQVYTINPDVSQFKFRKNDRMHDGVYYKFWLPILPYDKIIYIDCDVMCQRPLDSLWSIDCPFICATESHAYGKVQAKELGLEKYALSGMMVMNLKALREAHFTERCLERLSKEHPKFHDETIINLEFHHQIKFIDIKYNYCKNRTYDKPINESDAYFLHYVGKDQKQEMLMSSDFDGLSGLKEFFNNKSVAIVGNAESVLSKNFGDEIDKHDVVIRINKGFPSKNKLALGTKTTVLFLACTLTPYELAQFNAAFTVRRSKLCHNICDFNCSKEDRARLIQEGNYLRKLEHKKSQPSTGFLAINFVLSTNYNKLDLYGFDFFATPTYYNPKGYKTLHNGNKEQEKILEYQQCNLLKIH